MNRLCGWRRSGTLLPWLALGSCVRPAEERAQLDAHVGRATTEGGEVTVEGGLAVVRAFSRGRLELWGNAPEFGLAMNLTGVEALEIRIRNCMPGASLRVNEGRAQAAPLGARLATECAWSITPEDAAFRLEIEVPDDARESFEFAVLSDIQDAIVSIQDIYRAMNAEPGLRFVLSTGDLTSQGERSEMERFVAELEGLGIPYFSTLGNHELGESPTLFQGYFGRASSHFDFHGVHFTMLDSASATIDPSVYGRLDDWLDHAWGETHIVAMHIAPLDPIGVRNGAFASRAEAAKLLGRLAGGGVDLTLYGHIHSYYRFQNAGIEAHISGGGGAIPETFDGIGRHFLLVSVDPVRGVLGTRVVRVD